MRHIRDLLAKKETPKKDRRTERGELMRHFLRHLNFSRKHDGYPPLSMARLGKILEGIPTGDLYYLKSECGRAKNFSKKFWWSIDPKKHTQEAKDAAPF